ncbi:YceI family protein [Cytophagales bacterium LB-30]|uniref:YceI family protein n=1 Tax=Shiella aurantiaca TaxID=3058365 RepID=A0ABT8F8K3_9BACT|nr:YceI family protein [Shiella aurantiaca]MDN4166807.1 YceI family protein [Shiella aurantiaca]
MKKTRFLLLASALVIVAMSAFTFFAPKNWAIDKTHTSISFKINHFFTPVNGSFDSFKGNIAFDPANLAESKVNFTIDVASINTREPDRDKHLQSPDFFDAAKYPQISFVSSSFEKKGDNSYVAKGKLTMRDVTKDIELPFTVLGVQDHPFQKEKTLLGLKSNLSLDRTAYGVGTGSWAATAVVGDQVDIEIFMELIADK